MSSLAVCAWYQSESGSDVGHDGGFKTLEFVQRRKMLLLFVLLYFFLFDDGDETRGNDPYETR